MIGTLKIKCLLADLAIGRNCEPEQPLVTLVKVGRTVCVLNFGKGDQAVRNGA